MPSILLYNLDGDKGTQVRMLCMRLRIRIRNVSPSEYAEPVGALAGLSPLACTPCEGSFSDEMAVFVNFDGDLLNRFLREMRATRIPSIALKAVLTPTNQSWTSLQLHDELQREHEAMSRGGTAH